jgi:hypothetical protein
MTLRALAVLAAVAVAGCGGNDSEETVQAEKPERQTTGQKESNPEKLVGTRTRENVLRTLGLRKRGDVYDFDFPACTAVAVATTRDEVKKLEDAVKNEGEIIKNESGSAAVQLAEVRYFCAIHAKQELEGIP